MEEYKTGYAAAQALGKQLTTYVRPVLQQLDVLLDRPLVRTVLDLLQVMLVLRHNRYGLLLSELGGYLLGPAHAPAGTKRISNLLRSPRWSHALIDQYQWRQADRQVQALQQSGSPVLVVWDESVVEKPESWQAKDSVQCGPPKRSVSTASSRATTIHPPASRPCETSSRWRCNAWCAHVGTVRLDSPVGSTPTSGSSRMWSPVRNVGDACQPARCQRPPAPQQKAHQVTELEHLINSSCRVLGIHPFDLTRCEDHAAIVAAAKMSIGDEK